MTGGRIRLVVAGLAVAGLLAAGRAEPVQETIQVDGEGLTGIWRISSPESIFVGIPGGVSFGPPQDHFCRTERSKDGFDVHCLGWDFRNFHGHGTLKNGKVHLAGGPMLLRFVIDGDLSSADGFTGRFGVKVFGIRVDDDEAVSGRKVVPAPDAQDPAGQSKALADTLAAIAAGGDALPAASKRNGANRERLTASWMNGLGAVQAVIYLGEGAKPHDPKMQGTPVSVYDVEFERGERLCAVDANGGVATGIVCS